jgi:hypothetical protein
MPSPLKMTLPNLEKVLLFLIILFIPTQFGKHFWPQFSYIYSLPVDYLSPTLYFWDILVLIQGLFFVFSSKRVNKLALNLFFIFILTQLFSLLSPTANIGVGLVRLEQYFITGLFGVYIASYKKISARLFIWALVIAVIFESLISLGQFAKGATLGFWMFGERTFSISTPGISKFDYKGTEFLRPYATFPHPNVLAGFMILTTIILLNIKSILPKDLEKNFLESAQFKKIQNALTLSTLLGVLVILLTVSRVAIISGLVYITTFSTKNKDRLLIIVAILILLPVLYTRFASLANFDNLTFVRREELSLISLKLWSLSPILGVGLNNFIPTASDLLLAGPSRFLQPVHDIFLLSLSETGIVGFLGLMVLIGYPIVKIFKHPNKTFNRYPFLSLWTIIIFLSLFDHYFITLPQGYRLLFLIWGLSLRVLE